MRARGKKLAWMGILCLMAGVGATAWGQEAGAVEVAAAGWRSSRTRSFDRVEGPAARRAVGVDHVPDGIWNRTVTGAEYVLDHVGDLGPAQPTGEERFDRDLVGGAQPGRPHPTQAAGRVGERQPT